MMTAIVENIRSKEKEWHKMFCFDFDSLWLIMRKNHDDDDVAPIMMMRVMMTASMKMTAIAGVWSKKQGWKEVSGYAGYY